MYAGKEATAGFGDAEAVADMVHFCIGDLVEGSSHVVVTEQGDWVAFPARGIASLAQVTLCGHRAGFGRRPLVTLADIGVCGAASTDWPRRVLRQSELLHRER
jgi:hypothetical protein